MNLINHPNRIYLDLSVGLLLLAMLGFGSVYIFRLNNDAREQQLSSALAMQGQSISTDRGCVACHTVDGSLGVGPSWQGMWGRTQTLSNGNTVVVDEAYFRESLIDPRRKIVAGYPDVMLPYFLAEEEIAALIEFSKQLTPPASE